MSNYDTTHRPRGRFAAALFAAATAALGFTACAAATPDDFGPAITLAARGGSRPTTAVDPRDGTVYVAWVGTHAGSADVYLARLDPGTDRATDPVRVNQIPGDAAPHDQAPARVAVGHDGTVYLAWQNNVTVPGRRFPASNLRFARSTDRGASFEPTITVNDDAGGPPASHTFHDLATAADGTVIVSWIDSRVRAAASDSLAGHLHTAAATDSPAGHLHAATMDFPAGPEIRLARSTDGGRTFHPSRIIDREACPCCRTTLAVAPNGTAYIAWRKLFDGQIRDVVVARVDAGAVAAAPDHSIAPVAAELHGKHEMASPAAGQVHPPIRPHHDDWRLDACPHAGPALLADHAGDLHLAWYTGRPGRAGLYLASSTDQGATFTPPTPVLTADALPPSQLALAADGQGAVRIAWEDRRTAERRIRIARVGQGRLRGSPLTLSGTAPALAAAAGTTALAWLDGEMVQLRIAR
jgi:hypothetical protein